MIKISFLSLIILLLCSVLAKAQSPSSSGTIEMADGMRSNGMIYVVVGCLVIILIGLLAYLISIDRKVSRIEKNITEGKKDPYIKT